MADISEEKGLSIDQALRLSRQRAVPLLGQLNLNQGRATFIGRLTLEQLSDLTVAHNRKWAEDAGESLDVVTQREIIDAHANGLAIFMLQGLVDATIRRLAGDPDEKALVEQLEIIQDRVGRSAHYGLPQITVVIPTAPDIRPIQVDEEVVAAKLFLPSGRLLIVADGQHRREGSRRLREFLNDLIANRRIPSKVKFYPSSETALSADEYAAWLAIHETFRTWTMISYEAHFELDVKQARQLFTNINCHVKPVKMDQNLEFDQSNPINKFVKDWVIQQIGTSSDESKSFDLHQIAGINGFLFLGVGSIKSAPYDVNQTLPCAKEFWTTVLQSDDWSRPNSLLHEAPVLKGLAKAWFYVFVARRKKRSDKSAQIRAYIRKTKFDPEWVKSVPGLSDHTVSAEKKPGIRFSPAHNDIVARIVGHSLA